MNITADRILQIIDKPTTALMWEIREMAAHIKQHGGSPAGLPMPVTYRRTINRSLALWLVELVRRYAKEPRWYSTSEPWSLLACRGTGDIAKLRYWKLIEKAPNDDPKKKSSGLWRPTDLGIQFIQGDVVLQRTAMIREGKFLGLAGKTVSISDCLKEPFDYSKLMAEVVA